MAKLTSQDRLKGAILDLEQKREYEGKILKEQFHDTFESLKPINLIKSTLKDATGSPELKGNLVNTSVGLTAGYLSKALFQGISRSPFKRLIGTAIMFGITNIVAKHPKTVKKLGNKVINMLRRKQTADRGNGVYHAESH